MNIIKDKVLYSREELEKNTEHRRRYIFYLLHLIQKEVERSGDRIWLQDCQKDLTLKLSEIEPSCKKLASAFRKLGFKQGATLQMGSSNIINYYLPVFSAWLCGGVVSIADPNISNDQIQHQLQDTSATIVAIQHQFLSKYIDIRSRAKHSFKIVIIDGYCQEYPEEDVYNMDDLIQTEEVVQDNFELEDLDDPTEDALILWSSGSTGKPKGIVHSQINLLTADIPTSAKNHIVTNKVLMSNIMFHIGGFMIPIRLGFMLELTCGFISDFNAEECLDIIERFAPSVVYLGIGHYIELSGCMTVEDAGRGFPSLRCVVPCGGAVTPGIHLKMKSVLGDHVSIMEVYGSTEVFVVSSLPGTRHKQLGLLGDLAKGVSMYFRDTKTGEKLGPNQMGRIMVKTPLMLNHFLNLPEATKEFYSSGDGYGFMGDVGYYTETGDIFFSRRDKNTVKVDNFWFGPMEIEDLLEAIPDVQEAQVWGEYNPGTGNDIINAGISFTTPNRSWTVDKIKEYVANNLPASRKLTGDVVFVSSLPHSAQDKKIGRKMREWLNNNTEKISSNDQTVVKGEVEPLFQKCIEALDIQKSI